MISKRVLQRTIGLAILALLLVGCGGTQSVPTATSAPPTATPIPPTPAPVQSLSPTARGYHLMAYDAESDRIILFDGVHNPENGLNDTWAYDVSTSTWRDMSPAQSPSIGNGPMAYDIQSDRIVLFLGGLDPSGQGAEYTPAGETWTYDFNNNTWMNMEPTETPFGIIGTQMVYDTESDRMILFGGLDFIIFETEEEILINDTWAYDYDSNTWTKMGPEVSPQGRDFHTMAYDDSSDRVILFGGYPWLNDTWSYDYNTDTWEELEPGETPSARYYCDMVYDPGSDRMILFGGARAGIETPLGDTWAYHLDTNTWTELKPDTHPSERGWYAAVYSTKAERIVLFGGGKNRYMFTDETWIYDPQANAWTDMTPGS